MRKLINTFAGKAIVAAAVAGVATTAANAALSIDVRAVGGGKTINANPGDVVTVEVHLVSDAPGTDLANGLGSFALGIGSFNEKTNGLAWPVARTPTDTAANATNAVNNTNPAILDLGFSAGSNTDASGIGNPDTNDTDLDRTGIGGTQSAAGGWDISYGKVADLLLGTVSFQMLSPQNRDLPISVELNAFYAGASGTGGGAIVKSLTGTDGTTNGVSATNLITGAGQIGAPVVVAPIPEPASLGLLGIAAIGAFRRRRNA
jgi:hypothetical protein